jgi:rhodanese-related sulfurtransferase
MSSINTISVDKLTRLIGTAHCPVLVDVRTEDDFNANPRLIPSSMRRSHADPSDWAQEFAGRSAIAICQRGAKLSQGVAAWLRHAGVPADALEDGFEGWRKANLPLVPAAKMPPLDKQGRTVWVTRARPKIDRVACPWLIRRFIDPRAVFLFVAPAEVQAVAERFAATPFDVEGVFWSHRGESCTFDVMVEGVRARDRAARSPRRHRARRRYRPLREAPQAAGLLAASLGLSRMYSDDLAQLEAGMTLYDAFYRWCRDATDETHTWHTKKPGA